MVRVSRNHGLMINGALIMAGQSWPLQPSSLPAMRTAAGEPWQEAVVNFLESWWNEKEQVAAKTSGSTGIPQSIDLKKTAMVDSANRTIEYFQLVPGTRAGLAMPVHFIGGMMMVVRAVVGQWNLTVVEPSSAPAFGSPQDFVALTPPQARGWYEKSPMEWEACQTLLIGGGRASVDWMLNAEKGPRVFESFGMTETISHFAVREIHPKNEFHFQCLPGFEVRTAADGGMVVCAPSGAEIKTNDAIEAQGRGAFRWMGRLDEAVNSGGIKIHPAAVETELKPAVPGVFRCYGEPHEKWGEALVLRIHAEQEPADANEERARIFKWAKHHLPLHHAPKRIEWLPLETTWTGKWKRPRAHE